MKFKEILIHGFKIATRKKRMRCKLTGKINR